MKWSKEEEKILRKVFKSKGLTLRTYRRVRLVKEGLDEILTPESKFRTPDAIRSKARRMNLIKERRVSMKEAIESGDAYESGLEGQCGCE